MQPDKSPLHPQHNHQEGQHEPQNNTEDDDDDDYHLIRLPDGARDVVLHLVAQHILEEELRTMDAHVTNAQVQEETDAEQEDYAKLDAATCQRLEHLIQQFPSVCQRQYRFPVDSVEQNVYPLFLLLFWKPPLRLIQLAVNACPQALCDRVDGDGPLHVACMEGASLKVIEYLHHQAQAQLSSTSCCSSSLNSMNRCHALHSACLATSFDTEGDKNNNNDNNNSEDSAALAVFNFLLDAYPQAARETDMQGDLALHVLAANATAHVSLLQRLVQANPEGIWHADAEGLLPLHWACKIVRQPPETTVEWIDALCQACGSRRRDALMATDNTGWTPVMYAAAFQEVPVLDFLWPLLHDNNHDNNDEGPREELYVVIATTFNTARAVAFLLEEMPWTLRTLADIQFNLLCLVLEQRFDANNINDNEDCHLRMGNDEDSLMDLMRVLLEHDPGLLTRPNGEGSTVLEVAVQVKASQGILSFLQDQMERYEHKEQHKKDTLLLERNVETVARLDVEDPGYHTN